jgi:cytochrome b subunit of formate dehydrogenase
LLTSFFVLVITGFALRYPDSWLAVVLGMSEKVRSLTHRIAAVALIAAGIYHLIYLALSGEGRKLLKDFVPVLRDSTDVLRTLRYYLGLSDIRPRYARFNYAEKMEYWALVWGMFVMASTGIMLWAKVTFGHFLPRWLLDVATAIHFYEAVLATLAIVAWHFYQVFFDPDVYPMNWAWFDGKMSLHHYQEEHALDVPELVTPAPVRAADEPRLALPRAPAGDATVEAKPVAPPDADAKHQEEEEIISSPR